MASPSRIRSPKQLERLLSVVILVALAGVLAGIFLQQSQFNPAVLMALSAAKEAEAQKASGTSAPTPVAPAKELLSPWPEGLRGMSAPESFNPGTLSDKIDGKAELYLSAGFASLACQRVALTKTPSEWLELFAFDMTKPDNAYSVYSSQKRHEATELQLADYAYQAGNQLCFVHGRWYVELVGASESPALSAATEALARAFIAANPVQERADVSKEQALFPKEGMVEGSLSLIASDVFGFDKLSNVFVARYRDGKDEFSVFIAKQPSPALASELATGLNRFLTADSGGKALPASDKLPGTSFVDNDGSFDGLFTSGPYLCGVHLAPTREVAERWVSRLQTALNRKP
jgi:hypothetical protein